jgi:uncharacterized protein (DUF58 family)
VPGAQVPHLSESLLDDAFLRRLERLSLVAHRPATAGMGGEYRSRARAHSADFVDYRAYTPGDDLRRIDWNVYRRLDQLYVKLAEAREHLVTHLLLDCSASMDWGTPNKLAYARALSAAVGYIALGRNDLVSAVCLGDRVRSQARLRGRSRALDLLRFLDGARPDGRLDLEACVASLSFTELSGGRAGGQVVLLSDLLVSLDAFTRTLESLLAAQLDVIVVHLLSPEELEPQPGGDFALIDAETGKQVQVGLSFSAINRYLQRLEAWQEDVAAICAQRGVRCVRARTDEPLEEVVLTRLREGMVLA